ncbi:MAG: hypothetical protein SGJ24_01245 [Chloroflexota bacterium]|nr:hypothetical protein [Chloroflexota bacterium]
MSDPSFIQSQLRTLPLFTRLTPPQLALVAGITQMHRLAPGTLALGEGQPSLGMLAFASGRGVFTRRRPDGSEEQISTISGGQFVNEASLYAARLEPVSLRIVEDAAVLFIARDAFLKLANGTPELRANLRVPEQPTAATASPRATATIPVAPRPPRMNVTPAPTASQTAAVVTDQPQAPEPARAVGATLFKGQRADEQVLYVFRRHWWAFGRHLWMPIGIALIGIGAAIATAGTAAALSLAALAIGIIAAVLVTIYLYFEWRDDSIVLTDERIVRIWNFLIGFENSLSEIPLDRVLEVSMTVPPGDPFAQLFQYATLYIRTAGEAANLQLDLIADARNVQSLIFAQRDQFRNRVARQQQSTIQADIQAALGASPTVPVEAVASVSQPDTNLIPLQAVDTAGLPFVRTRYMLPNGDIAYRHHTTVWLAHVAAPSLLIAAALVLIGVSALVPASPLPGALGVAVGLGIIAVAAVWFFLSDWDWRNDMLILSADAVTIIRKRPLWLQNQVERMRVSQIDNVTSEVEGLIDNILTRGEVRIALIGASQAEIKRFANVYDPQSIQSEISRRLSVLRSQRQTEDLEQQRQVMLDYLAAYHQMQGTGGATPTPAQVQPGMTFQRPTPPPIAPQPPSSGTVAPPPSAPDAVRPPRVPRSRDSG